MEEIIRDTAEVEAAPVETAVPKAEDTAPPEEDGDPEDAVYRSLDWETNPPINGFYEMMMSLTPERRAELRRLGKAKIEANAAREAVGTTEAKRENNDAGKTEELQGTAATAVYPVENGFEAERKRRIAEVEEAMRREEAALTPEERQRKREEEMMPRPYSRPLEPHLKDGSLAWVHTQGVRYQVGVLKDVTRYGATFHPLDMEGMQKEKAQLYISMRDTYERLYAQEAERQEANDMLRRHLNTYYDEFTMRYGCLNARQNVKLLMMDASGRNMLALERSEGGTMVKADIFDRPVSFSQETTVTAESPEEALSASLNRYGGVNLPYMESLCDMARTDMLEALKGRVYYNPMAGNYEIADRFIAGNVVVKAKEVEEWVKGHGEHGMMPQAREALAALKEAMPEQIPFEELDFNFGERWIPTGVYAAYMSRLFETDVRISYSESLDEYSVACGHRTMKITDEFLVKGYYRHYDGMHLLKHALHNTCPDMMKKVGEDEHGKDIKARDSEGIQLANAKIDEIRGGFTEWLEEQSPEFKKRLTDMYNNKFNCFVRPKYDGSHQTFPGLDLKGLGDHRSVPQPEGLHLDAETERRRNSRPRGGHRQDADHVRGCTRDEAAGAGTQADDNRSESQCARDSGDLPQGIPQRPRTVRIGEGLRGGQPRALLQRHTEQRLGLRHHVARPVREDTAVAGAATADIAGGAGHGGGKSGGAPLAGQGCVTRHAEGIGEAQVQPDGQAGEGGTRDKVEDGRRGGLQADGYRPYLHRRVAPVQEPDIQHKT